MLPQTIATKNFIIPSLDGIRAVAVLIVFLSHAGFDTIVPGGLGVTIFFFLSGYLITTLMRLELERTGRVNLRHFYVRRLLRIWPSFYLVLIIGAALTSLNVIQGKIDLSAFLAQLLHFANYQQIFWGGNVTPGSGVFWSLAVEEHFYLFFPLIYLAISNRRSAKSAFSILMALCLIFLGWRLCLIWLLDSSHYHTFYSSDTRFDSLLFGCGLAIYKNPVIDTSEQPGEKQLKYFFLPIGIALLIFTLLYRAESFRETFRYTIQGVALYPIFIAAINYPNWWPFRLLNSMAARFVGVLSYSLYLVHHTVIIVAFQYLHDYAMPIKVLVALFVSLLFAYAIYVFVEAPLVRFRKKFSHQTNSRKKHS